MSVNENPIAKPLSPRVFQFGPNDAPTAFELTIDHRGEQYSLRGPTNPKEPVERQALVILGFLIEHRNDREPKTKDDIAKACNESHVSGGWAPNYVSRIRKLLQESYLDPVIRNVPNRGYRFIWPVQEISSELRVDPSSLKLPDWAPKIIEDLHHETVEVKLNALTDLLEMSGDPLFWTPMVNRRLMMLRIAPYDPDSRHYWDFGDQPNWMLRVLLFVKGLINDWFYIEPPRNGEWLQKIILAAFIPLCFRECPPLGLIYSLDRNAFYWRLKRETVDWLIADLEDVHVEVRLSAALALGSIGGGQAIRALIQANETAFRQQDRLMLAFTIKALARIGPDAIPHINAKRSVVATPYERHLVDLIYQIETGGGHSLQYLAVDPVFSIIKALRDGDRAVRKSSVKRLIKIGRPAVPHLIEIVRGRNKGWRRAARGTLVEIGPTAVARLIQELESGDRKARGRAIVVLGQIGPIAHRAVPFLIRTLGEEDVVLRRSAIYALQNIAPEVVSSIPAFLEKLAAGSLR